jgi:2-polyprenyl-6-methoxyphenol hydroxylase-like FAD-dependent oxidoreductase
MARTVVVGAGVSGLGAALVLARDGHLVTVIERDDTPMPASADEAFEWDRRGAPQVRHSHAFLARLTTLLRDHHPDVLAALEEHGATPIRFGDDLPPTLSGYEREPGDDDLVMLACRRTTFEWVLRRVVQTTHGVEIRTGHGVTGLTASAVDGELPRITGVVLDDGTTVEADLTVVANGRRSALPDWLDALGIGPVDEEVEDTGIVYLSRFYRLREEAEAPPRAGLIGGDLGYLKYGVFIGDARTFSITLAVPVNDDDLRRRLADPATFEAVARELVATAPWLDGRAEPITEQVHVMAGLLNRWREYVVDGNPLALSVFPVGDALMCTNPLYGRGCSTGFWSAHLLGDALAAHPDDPLAQAVAYDAAVRSQLRPWYRSTVLQDAEARRVAAALLAGEDPDGDSTDPRTFMRSVFRDGLAPALRLDAVVLRAFMRNFNLLTPPEALVEDADVNARVLAVWNERDQREPEPLLGPSTRKELLDAIGSP